MGQEEEGAAGQGIFRKNGLNGHWLMVFYKKKEPPSNNAERGHPKNCSLIKP
jgi:hypothetical protein